MTITGALARGTLALVAASVLSAGDNPVRRGPYLGEEPPGPQPRVFAPGLVSQRGRMERALVFSPDQTQALFAVTTPDYRPTLLHMRQVEGRWTDPRPATFAVEGNNTEPAFSADSQRVYFASNRPPGSPPYQADLWMAERDGDNWGPATHLGPPISSSSMDFHPTVSEAETLCFASARTGNPDLFCARSAGKGEGFEPPAPLDELNTEHQEWDPFIAPDESYLIFKSDRPGGLGGMDGYIAFRAPGGEWGEPRLIPAPVNTPGPDDVGDISPDGRYLFFSRRDGDEMDVYWVEAGVALDLRDDPAASGAAAP